MIKRQSGFTIVELLIVVVVIGILAAIVTVAYTGITQRAQQASIQSGVSQMTKLLSVYLATNGSYPTVGGTTCLAGWKAAQTCHISSGNDPARNSSLESELQTVGTIPSFPNDVHSGYWGLTLYYDANDTFAGQPARYTLYWTIPGDSQDCDAPNSVSKSGDVYTLASFYSTWSGTTNCRTLLPDS